MRYHHFGQWLVALLFVTGNALADDGYRLWLKYNLINDASKRAAYAQSAQFIAVNGNSEVLKTAAGELQAGLQGLLGKPVPIIANAGSRTGPRSVGGIVLTVANGPGKDAQALNDEGYRISNQQGNLSITGKTDAGVLYGIFAVLRQMQTGQSTDKLALVSSPKTRYRMLNHWDNPLGTIERGYAGSSLWKWYELPETIDPRYRDYARANASLGINGTVVNNVNASPRFLTDEYLTCEK